MEVAVRPARTEQEGLVGVSEQALFADALVRALIQRGEPGDPYTFFVPSNESLNEALRRSGRILSIVESDKVLANQLLDIHLVEEKLASEDLRSRDGETLTTTAGDAVSVVVEETTGRLFLELDDGTRIRLIATDLETGVGIVHIIERPIRVP